MTTYLIIAAVIGIGFGAWCLFVDSKAMREQAAENPEWEGNGAKGIAFRLIAKHVKLFFKLLMGVIYFVLARAAIFGMQKVPGQGNAPEGRLANFADRVTYPIQMVVDGLIGFLGLVALAVCLGAVWMKDIVFQHELIVFAVVILTYLAWLVLTIMQLVEEEAPRYFAPNTQRSNEYGSPEYAQQDVRYWADGRPIDNGTVTKSTIITWSVVTFAVWVSILATPYALFVAGIIRLS
jgi:hypothetical protein